MAGSIYVLSVGRTGELGKGKHVESLREPGRSAVFSSNSYDDWGSLKSYAVVAVFNGEAQARAAADVAKDHCDTTYITLKNPQDDVSELFKKADIA